MKGGAQGRECTVWDMGRGAWLLLLLYGLQCTGFLVCHCAISKRKPSGQGCIDLLLWVLSHGWQKAQNQILRRLPQASRSVTVTTA